MPPKLGPSFTKLLVSSASSNLADGLIRTSVPLLAATFTRDPLVVSLVSASAFLPWLLFALPSGAFVDRIDRRSAIVAAGALRALLVGTCALAVLADAINIRLLSLLVFALGAIETVYESAARALLPALVPPDGIDAGNGRLGAAEMGGESFIGPPVAGVLFALAMSSPFLFGVGGYALAAVIITGLPRSHDANNDEAEPLVERITEGLRWLRNDPAILGLTICGGVLALTSAGVGAVFVLFALEVLDLDATGFGILLAVAAVGGVIGSLIAARVVAKWGRRKTLLGSLVLGGFAFAGLGLVSDPVPAAAFYVLGSGTVAIWNTVTMSVRQTLIPARLFRKSARRLPSCCLRGRPGGRRRRRCLGQDDHAASPVSRGCFWPPRGARVRTKVALSRHDRRRRTLKTMRS
ncbi:MAG: MFS transporter [Acidimicrobiales bacterium]